MATVQTNWRLDIEVRDWLAEQAKQDDRDPGVFLSRLIRSSHMSTKPVVKEAKQPRKVKTAIPVNFELNDFMRESAYGYWDSKGRRDLNALEEFVKFKDSAAANGRKYVDWNAAWRTWYTNAVQFNKAPNNGRKGSGLRKVRAKTNQIMNEKEVNPRSSMQFLDDVANSGEIK